MRAVITAGGCVDRHFAAEIGTPYKALAPWRSGRLIDTAIGAARACGAASIAVVAPPAVAAYCREHVDEILPAADDGRVNLALALRHARGDEALVLLTSDLPFLSPAALGEFLARAAGAQVAMPLAAASAYRQAFPGAADHCTRLGTEEIANGSVFYFSSASAAAAASKIAQQLFAARKSLFAMARLLDVPLLARFLFRSLEISHLQSYARRKFGLEARAVRDASPVLCYDIDDVADYRYANSHLSVALP